MPTEPQAGEVLPKPSADIGQVLASFDHHKQSRRMGTLTRAEMDRVKSALRDLLGLYAVTRRRINVRRVNPARLPREVLVLKKAS